MDIEEIAKTIGFQTKTMYYDMDNRPFENVNQWGEYKESLGDGVIIRSDHIGKYYVSTVYIGLDMNLFRGRPLIFETMIFTDDSDREDELDMYQDRYTTKEEANLGHEKALKLVRDKHDQKT